MLSILFRTLAVYVALIATMRLMGKRQIGELEVTDLVTTLLLSEIAALPITNPDIPLLNAILPMGVLLVLEVLSSLILVRLPRLKPLVSAKPTVIIQNGRLRQKALGSLRISVEELMSELRQQGLTDLAQVDCAILEKNGKLTVLPKPLYAPPTAKDLGMTPKQEGLMHVVFCNRTYSRAGLALIGKDRAWLDREAERRGLVLEKLFCVTANEKGELYWIGKEDE
ncbi:MAG: DUF421 domain-containing protein [Clostridia bacterium]|jgi:uncharacterized membrane protein YcaP (DUF421 family)|nr:DUF421 domain-containing protein [Clostridia bacterium]